MTRVLLVRLGALGDVVHALPVATALRHAFPDAQIDWLVDPRYAEVVNLSPAVTRAIPFDPRGLMTSSRRGDTFGVVADLRRQRYDVVFDLQGLLKSAAVARMSGGARTIGFTGSQLREPAARLFYTDTVEAPPDAHIIQKNLSLLRAVGVQSPQVAFDLRVPASPRVEQAMAGMGARGYLVINPGAAWPNKRWPPERFGRVAAEVRASHGLPTMVTWGPGEEALAEAVVAASNGAASRAPSTTVVQLFRLMQGARLAMAGDTGPLHIAAAVGTPVVALFGPTWPARNGPWRAEDISVSRAAACECHYQRQCRRAVPCISEITVEEVMGAVARRLAEGQVSR